MAEKDKSYNIFQLPV